MIIWGLKRVRATHYIRSLSNNLISLRYSLHLNWFIKITITSAADPCYPWIRILHHEIEGNSSTCSWLPFNSVEKKKSVLRILGLRKCLKIWPLSNLRFWIFSKIPLEMNSSHPFYPILIPNTPYVIFWFFFILFVGGSQKYFFHCRSNKWFY